MEPQEIREGYLVKKGTVLNSWKAVWVVLSEDGMEFFKRKTDRSPKGMIPLKGAALVSPCQDFCKRMLVFKLTTDKKQDHFFQASHVEEREFWVKDIKRAITCLQGGKRFARKSTRRSIRLAETINLNELYALLKDQDDGVKELKLEQENRVFNHCFTGATVVDWLISKEKARNRPEALMLATGLLNEGFLQPAGDMAKDGAECEEQTTFLDRTEALYYFVDSGFFCEGYSSDEDVLVKEEFRGNIIKQGCLLKQGDDPLGSIHLRGSVVTAVEYVPDAKKYDIDGNLFEIITSDEVHYFFQAATGEERKDWIKAIQAVAKSGK
ncbi:pleckstrin isoform X2 [Scophthalmus maximus]|uniref:pleckstrin isoform X2 n=1 Tax=Scophthalmus maximus TaxID=52904 RepID=UPI000F3205BE|nr:pleckstrin isoform X2 [Scophthalmus maximus]